MAGRPRFYRARHATSASAAPVFFYHLPKCAGMSFHSAVYFSWTYLARAAKFTAPPVVRVDDESGVRAMRGVPYTLVSSHLPFGTHRALVGQPELITFLRDPVARLRSAFT